MPDDRRRPGRLLTLRELELAQHLCRRDEPQLKQVAATMGVTYQTAETMRTRVYAKLACHSRQGLLWRMLEVGYLRLPSDEDRILDTGTATP